MLGDMLPGLFWGREGVSWGVVGGDLGGPLKNVECGELEACYGCWRCRVNGWTCEWMTADRWPGAEAYANADADAK